MSAPLRSTTGIAEAEWRARCDLVEVHHVMRHLGCTDLIDTFMPARVPGEPNASPINDDGETSDEITAPPAS